MVRQALVAGGGKGTKLGALARRYGNKSLVPVNGRPTILYTVRWLREAGIGDIIVTVNYRSEAEKLRELFRSMAYVRVVTNRFRKSSAQCVGPALPFLDPRFLFIYGHAPAPPAHLVRLIESARGGIAVSLYPTTTQENPKPATLGVRGNVSLADDGDCYVEPPHVMNRGFARLLERTASWSAALYAYVGTIPGVPAHHPSEFHYPADYQRFRTFMRRYAGAARQSSSSTH